MYMAAPSVKVNGQVPAGIRLECSMQDALQV